MAQLKALAVTSTAAVFTVLSMSLVPAEANIAAAGAASSDCPVPGSDEVYDADDVDDVNALECDLVGADVEIPDADASIPVPEPGYFIEVDLMVFDDEAYSGPDSMVIAVDQGGNLEIVEEIEDPGEPGYAPANDPCADSAYNLLGSGPITANETFRINKNSFPSTLDEQNTTEAIIAGMRAWPDQFDDCDPDLADQVSVDINYGGSTTAGTSNHGTSTTTTCNTSLGSFDDASVVAFGIMNSDFVGSTCRYGTTIGVPHIIAGDIRLNKQYFTWTNVPGGSACNNDLDVQSVVAHEAGHWWGMDHVTAPAHRRLTMTVRVNQTFFCTNWMRSLGRGDILGMRAMY